MMVNFCQNKQKRLLKPKRFARCSALMLLTVVGLSCGGRSHQKEIVHPEMFHPIDVQMDPISAELFPLLSADSLPITEARLDTELAELSGANARWIGKPGHRTYIVEIAPSPSPDSPQSQLGIPLVLVHGLGDAGMRDFYPVVSPLARNRPLLLIDLPNLARSESNKTPTPIYFAQRVAQIIQSRIDGPFDLLGHSLGGNVCLTLAAHPKMHPQHLVIVDAAGVLHREAFVKNQVDTGTSSISRVHKGLGRVVKGVGRTLVEVSSGLEPPQKRLHDGANHLPGSGTQAAVELILHRIGPYISAIESPTLLLWGQNDTIAPLRTGQLLRDRINTATLHVLPKVAHVPMKDDPKKFANAVLQFIDEPLRPQMPKSTPIKSAVRVDCNGKTGRVFSGRYSSLELINCREADIENAEIGQLRLEDSRVKLTGVLVTNGTFAIRSNVVITGGKFAGPIALYMQKSTADIAGAVINGSTHAIASQKGARFLFSVTVIHSPHHRGILHDRLGLNDGDAL